MWCFYLGRRWIGFFLLLMFNIGWADTVEFRTVVSRNDGIVGGEFHLDLEMRITSGPILQRTLNSLTIDVNYGTGLANVATPSANWAFDGTDGYARSVTNITNPQKHYRVVVTGNDVNGLCDGSGPFGWDVTSSFQRICTLKWTIASSSTNISIDDATDAAAYFPNIGNIPCEAAISWTVSNQDLGDASLPVQLSSFTAESIRGQVLLKWQTQSEIDNLGFNILRSESKERPFIKVNSEIIEGAGNSTTLKEYSYTDDRVQKNQIYYYKLEDIDIKGFSSYHGPIEVFVKAVDLPERFSLEQNYPNPFNPATVISYTIPIDCRVTLRLFNLRGEAVRTLVDSDQPADYYTVRWNGTSDSGQLLPTGIYFCNIQAGQFSNMRKLIFAR
jgi:hypothetical protein